MLLATGAFRVNTKIMGKVFEIWIRYSLLTVSVTDANGFMCL